MNNKTVTLWQITAITNLHVGNENSSNFGIIDKCIQRNPITELPCINSSSLKGALREYLSESEYSALDKVFGSSNEGKGNAVFFDANLLYVPIPTEKNTLYSLVTSESVREEFTEICESLNVKAAIDPFVSTTDCDNIKAICSDEKLPIIARNSLEDGVSKNLWYEQIVPQQTSFYTFIELSDADKLGFIEKLNGKVVQIGANATIGYGYCKFTLLNPDK